MYINMENQKEIEKTLNSLDSLQKAEIHPFLYEKIKHRMQQGKIETKPSLTFSWKLASVLVIVIFINVFTCVKYKNQEASQKTNTENNTNSDTENYYYNTSYNY